jgi:hypothetical protein
MVPSSFKRSVENPGSVEPPSLPNSIVSEKFDPYALASGNFQPRLSANARIASGSS